MNQTERLYYTQPRLFTCEAKVVAVEGAASAPSLILDRSIFYPEGGGQPCDLGTISGVPLAEVIENGGLLIHRLAAPLESRPGDSVQLSLDFKRRRDHTEQHSAQHLLSGLFSRLFATQTVSFHLGMEHSTIDLAKADFSEEDLDLVESEANAIIAEDYPYTIHVSPPENIADLPLRKKPPVGQEEIRIVEIDGLDYSPCCGTHVERAGELRLVKILSGEHYKGMTRLTFLAGSRALDDYRRIARSAREASRALSAAVQDLGPEAERIAQRLKQSLGEAQSLRAERAALEAEVALLRAETKPRLLSLRFEDRSAEAAQMGAFALAERGVVGVASSVPDLTACIASPDRSGNIGSLLKPLALAREGRGGGGKNTFRAAFPTHESLEAFIEEACSVLESTISGAKG